MIYASSHGIKYGSGIHNKTVQEHMWKLY